MPPQEAALQFVAQHPKTLLVAPTSFGKTLILKEYIFRYQPKVVSFIVPTNALAYELESSFKNNPSFDDYDIYDREKKGEDKRKDKMIFIGTQEKYLEIEKSFPQIDLFVIDEAYKLSEDISKGTRSYKLSFALFYSGIKKSNKICLLTPCSNPIGFEDYSFKTFRTTFNAVAKRYKQVAEAEFYDKVSMCAQNQKTILYCRSPEDINKTFEKIKLNKRTDDQFLAHLKADFHREWSVTKFYEAGVLVHHGQMPKYVQNRMARKFLQPDSNYLLIGTNSISEGINTPAKNVFIDPRVDFSKQKMLIKNTIGRAGRLGVMPVGYVYAVDDLSALDKEEIDVTLNVSDEEQRSLLVDTDDTVVVSGFCEDNHIDIDSLRDTLSRYKISFSRFKKIISQFKRKYMYGRFDNVVHMYFEIEDERWRSLDETHYLAAFFKNFYIYNDERQSLRSLNDKIEYIKRKSKNGRLMSDSSIIDCLMRTAYSHIDYDYSPIAEIGKIIHDSAPEFEFGENAWGSIEDFLTKFRKYAYGAFNFDAASEEHKSVISALREYGVNLSAEDVDDAMIEELCAELHVRYSSYDVINAIKRIARSNSTNAHRFKRLQEKYCD